ncbi:hypothetical protein TNCV_2848621 [Trichonephila clavipes]|nr:hypothetical protein TNCV_2848621 [Trichonephila clavipes]
MRMIGLRPFGSQHTPIRHVAHIFGGEYSPSARIHATHALQIPVSRTHVTPCVVHSTDKRTGFSETPIEAFECFSVRQEPRKKSFHVLPPALHGIPILYDVNEMNIGPLPINIPTAVKTEKHDE